MQRVFARHENASAVGNKTAEAFSHWIHKRKEIENERERKEVVERKVRKQFPFVVIRV